MKKLSFIFPGQGSQSLGMMKDLFAHKVVKDTLQEASTILNIDVERLVTIGPKEDLDSTINTQPVMLATSVAIYRHWCSLSTLRPDYLAGHSLGEYTALTVAGVIEFADALKIVRFRAEVMQQCVPKNSGGMAAILGLADEEVIAVCHAAQQQSGKVVEAVNFNAPQQVVIAGDKAALDLACQLAKERGAKRALPLSVSAPFHSSLLRPAAQALGQEMARYAFNPPCIPVVNNVDVVIADTPAAIKDALVRQAAAPVQWVRSVEKLAQLGTTTFIECGVGKVLTGLVKRITPDIPVEALNDDASIAHVLATV